MQKKTHDLWLWEYMLADLKSFWSEPRIKNVIPCSEDHLLNFSGL